jgi:hypothetical protein
MARSRYIRISNRLKMTLQVCFERMIFVRHQPGAPDAAGFGLRGIPRTRSFLLNLKLARMEHAPEHSLVVFQA